MISFALQLGLLAAAAAPVESGAAGSPAASPEPRSYEGETEATAPVSAPPLGATSGSSKPSLTAPSAVDVAPSPPERSPSPAAPAPDAGPESVDTRSPSGPVWTPGAQVFLRSEGRINPDFSNSASSTPNAAAVLERARLQLRGSWGPVTVFVQAQDARVWGFESSTISNEANTDLHQGWMELSGSLREDLSGSIRAGRQEINWGSQRMIGSLLWAPAARSFDALRLQGRAGRWSADAFLAVLAPPSTFSFGDPPQSVRTRGDQLAAGLVSFAASEALNVEATVLTDFADASMNAPNRDRQVIDIGGRIWGSPLGGLRYEAEGHGQTGRNEGLEHRAWAWIANVNYTRMGKRLRPGAKLSYAMASGSQCRDDPANGAADCGAETSADFFNFYPTNHIHYGLVDLLGWRNMRDLEISGSLAFEWFSASLGYHFLQLHRSTGRWRNAGGGLVGAGWDPNNSANTLGHEIDLVSTLRPWKPLMIQPGYGIFLPRKAGQNLGGVSPQHFVYLWLVTTF